MKITSKSDFARSWGSAEGILPFQRFGFQHFSFPKIPLFPARRSGPTAVSGASRISRALCFGGSLLATTSALHAEFWVWNAGDASWFTGANWTPSGTVVPLPTSAGAIRIDNGGTARVTDAGLNGTAACDSMFVSDSSTLVIENGGSFHNFAGGYIGGATVGTVTVTGAGSVWTMTSDDGLGDGYGGLLIGTGSGAGELNILDGGTMNFTSNDLLESYLVIGAPNTPNALGRVLVSGPGSTLTADNTNDLFNPNSLIVGGGIGSNLGSMVIADGGTVISKKRAVLGLVPTTSVDGSVGQVIIYGTPGRRGVFEAPEIVSLSGRGEIILAGGILRARQNQPVFLDSAVTFAVTADGGTLDTQGFDVGCAANLQYFNNGAFTKQGTGTLTMTGFSYASFGDGGSVIVEAGTLRVGVVGALLENQPYTVNGGTLDLNLSTADFTMSSLSGNGGAVLLSTSGSDRRLRVDQSGDTTYAGAIIGNGELNKLGAGRLILTGANTYNGNGSVAGTVVKGGTLEVQGGSISHALKHFWVGDASGDNGKLVVSGGGTVTNSGGVIAYNPGSTGEALVTGAGSEWINTGFIFGVGNEGNGRLTLTDGGKITLTNSAGALELGTGGGIGRLNIGAGLNQTAAAPGILNVPLVDNYNPAGTGILFFNHTSPDYHFTKTGASGGTPIPITGYLSLAQLNGTTSMAGANTYVGGTSISGGTLVPLVPAALGAGTVSITGGSLKLDGNLTLAPAAPVSLFSNGSVIGTGTLTLGATVNGTFAPGSGGAGRLTAANALTLGASSTTHLDLGGTTRHDGSSGTYDTVQGNDAINLGGTVNVTLINGFTPALGQSFILFAGTSLSGSASLNLPALASGLAWDSSAFATTGTITVVAGTYATWIASHGLNGPDAAPDADPEGDGLNNGTEYAFNLNPVTAATGQQRPQVSMDSGLLQITFRRPVGGVPGVTYGAQTNTDLTSAWTPAVLITDYSASSPAANGDGTETLTYTFNGPLTDRKFARLSFTF